MASTTVVTAADASGAATISAIPPDIIATDVLPRLDCHSLAALSSVSSYFRSLSYHDSLWRNICLSTWPSIDHPRVLRLISQFSNGHRGFFSDSLPLLNVQNDPRNLSRPSQSSSSFPSEVIFAVDIWSKNKLIFSRVLETETGSGWFEHTRFRVDLLDPKEAVPTQVRVKDWDDDSWRKELEKDVTLSWIIIDPIRKRSANLSTLRPVSAEKHWLTGEVTVEFGSVLGHDCRVGLSLTCGGGREEELHVKEACIQMEDIDGKCLNGRGSLGILVEAMELGERRMRKGEENEGMRRHVEYLERKKRRRERKAFGKRIMDMVSIVGVAIFVGCSTLFLFSK